MNYRHLSLLEAERELVGACIDHESALPLALYYLPLDWPRSHEAHDLRRVFYALAGMLERGAFTEDNRAILQHLWDDPREGYGYLDGLWCPWGVSPECVAGLCDAINQHNQLQDDALRAVKRWRTEDPLSHEFEEISQAGTVGAFRR